MSHHSFDPTLLFPPTDGFAPRHIGPSPADQRVMLETLGLASLDSLIEQTIPSDIRTNRALALPSARGEHAMLSELRAMADRNQVYKSYLGLGYYDCLTPTVILRNIIENPGWYTAYTPYQAEIAQGRLEALINFQTLVCDLTALPLANASLLDEGTAAAEAMTMAHAAARAKKKRFIVAANCHPQTIAVVEGRAAPLGIHVEVAELRPDTALDPDCFGVLVQYPATDGRLEDYRDLCARAHDAGALVIAATDLLALTLAVPPGEWGADIAVGSSQRFGVPLGFGGPHAGFLATRDAHKRLLPGRLIGVSRDAAGNLAYRMALQTREQHIRRDRATSNICTAQVLLAIVASMYAVYHGPEGLRAIARRVHGMTAALAAAAERAGYTRRPGAYFDTLRLVPPAALLPSFVLERAAAAGINLRDYGDGSIGVALDETVTAADLTALIDVLGARVPSEAELAVAQTAALPESLRRTSDFLTHPVFHRYHAEHELLRYIHRLQAKDLSLTTAMIPLGSCTMKLNATSEMIPITWRELGGLHPFAPAEQTEGYAALFASLEASLAEITGFPAVSLQPNAGSQGELAGLMVIRAYHAARGEGDRDVCLIPVSAHGTNAASAVMAGFRVIPVACRDNGDIDLADLQSKADEHAPQLAALMITYPSTHGVFEARVREICAVVHARGGQVYLDGANMNAQVGLMRPAEVGADVCHLNLHKTFCIPHGGGGPGMGPIAAAAHLAPFLPGHPLRRVGGERAIAPISAAPWGSPSILPISWAYIAMMGAEGLTRATQVAILNANYMAERLRPHYDVLYTGENGRVAHEFILDLRPFKASAGIEPEDVAKRLMDYGFHAPTMSWPVPGTIMVEPTESESKAELDRFVEALVAIRQEIRDIEEGRADAVDNPLKNAPHTAAEVTAETWTHPYSRAEAAYPAAWLREHKYWPPVARIDNAYGDRNLFCSCPPLEALESVAAAAE
jgi:glycine dehydrogenase